MEDEFPIHVRLVGRNSNDIKEELPFDDTNILVPIISFDDTDIDSPSKDELPIEIEEGMEQNTQVENEQETHETIDPTVLDEGADPIDDIEMPNLDIPTEQVEEPVNQTDETVNEINETVNQQDTFNRKSLRLRRPILHRYDPSTNRKASSSTFSCRVCRRKFKKKASMIYHRAKHSYLFPIHCDTCYINFSNNDDKTAHEKGCTLKKFECYVCSAIASSMGHLKNHMHKHTGEKPFVCLECNVRFSAKKSLIKHDKLKHQ